MRKQTTVLALFLAAVMSLALFMISYQVQDLEDQLDSLNRDIARDGRAVHVLQAEWAHLNDPERLRSLADKYLGLTPVGTRQLGEIEDIPWRPLHEASMNGADPSATSLPAETSTPVDDNPRVEPSSANAGSGTESLDDAIPAIRRALGLTRTSPDRASGGGIINTGKALP